MKAPLLNRIVQRAVLNILQDGELVPTLQEYFQTPTSFGGIVDQGLEAALKAAHAAIKDGNCHYIRSDIKSFFTKIPKPFVLDTIFSEVNDEAFQELVQSAVQVELENMQALGGGRNQFPLEDQGVAQGCCLSPILGNIFLHGFDHQLNGRGITCLRYIDDFLIVGPTHSKTRAAFESARAWLGKYGMDAYDPTCELKKADQGRAEDGLSFLGCVIRIDKISPGRPARDRLLDRVDTLLKASLSKLNDPFLLKRQHRDFAATLSEVNNLVTAWGNQYSYCNDRNALVQLDQVIDSRIYEYTGRVKAALRRASKEDERYQFRRILGVQPLIDSKSKPIIKARNLQTQDL